MQTPLGNEYAKMYRTSALREIAEWADRASVGLNDHAKEAGPHHAVEAAAHREDAETYRQLASIIREVLDEEFIDA